MNTTNNNGTTAAKVNERAQQYDEVTKVIRISFEHDGRMSAEDAREFIEMHYNNNTDRDTLASFIAEDISRAAVEVFGKGRAAYLLDVIANRVQSWCNPALSDEE